MTQQKRGKDILRNSAQLAEHKSDISDYKNSSELSSGLAVTHEQFGDVYAAGTREGAVQLETKTVKVPNEGFEHSVDKSQAQLLKKKGEADGER